MSTADLMTLGIMQPYLFPYLGYFQLLAAVDRFVVYDDVAFIKQGWINRNRILVGGKAHLFTVPLRDASSFRPIHETLVDAAAYGPWLRKFLMTIDQSYRSAPQFASVRPLIHDVFDGFEGSIGALALRGLEATMAHVGIDTPLVDSSRAYRNAHLKGSERVIDICLREGADNYLNSAGGRELYRLEEFAARGISLRFLQPIPGSYPQFTSEFVPALSIIDVMMFNSTARIREMLGQYQPV